MQEHSIAEEEALILSKLDKKPFYLGEVVTKISIYSGITTFGIFNVFFIMNEKSRKKLFRKPFFYHRIPSHLKLYHLDTMVPYSLNKNVMFFKTTSS